MEKKKKILSLFLSAIMLFSLSLNNGFMVLAKDLEHVSSLDLRHQTNEENEDQNAESLILEMTENDQGEVTQEQSDESGNTGEIANPLAIITSPASKTVAEGNTAKFGVVASGTSLSYQWQYRTSASGTWNNSGASGNKTDLLSFTASLSLNGYQYRCKVSSNDAIIYTAPATLTVVSKPVITTHPGSKTVAEGNTAKFGVVANGSNLSYQWQYRTSSSGSWNNSGASGNKTDLLSFTASPSQNGYQYRCKVSKGSVAVYTNVATLTVNAKPKISTHPGSKTVAEGNKAKFGVVASGNNLSYQWQYRTSSSGAWKNSGASGNKTDLLSFTASLDQNGYQYRCKVSSGVAFVYTNAATLTVNSVLLITTQPKSKTVSEGSVVKFGVVATGNNLSYQWQYRTSASGTWQNSGASGNKTDLLSFTASSSQNGYQYRCKVSSGAATVYTNAATLTCTAKLKITTHPGSKTVAEGSTARFGVVASGSNLSYQWQYRTSSSGTWTNSGASGSKTDLLTFTASSSLNGYQYRCRVSDGSSTVYSNAATLTVSRKTTYRALLVAEVNFSPVCNRNYGDCMLMQDMLNSVKGPDGGSYSGHINIAVDSSPSEIISLISSTFAGATSDDVSLFFIATHGITDVSTGRVAGGLATIRSTSGRENIYGGDGYYYNCNNVVLFDEIADALNKIPGKVIVVIESCGAGACIYSQGVPENAAETQTVEFNDAEFSEKVVSSFRVHDSLLPKEASPNTGEFRIPNKFYVLAASRHMEYSYGTESGPWNFFTKWLTDGVGTSGSIPADSYYGNGDGYVTLEELFSYISGVGDTYFGSSESDNQHVQRYPMYSDYELFKR